MVWTFELFKIYSKTSKMVDFNELASADEIQSDENISSEVPDIGYIIFQ